MKSSRTPRVSYRSQDMSQDRCVEWPPGIVRLARANSGETRTNTGLPLVTTLPSNCRIKVVMGESRGKELLFLSKNYSLSNFISSSNGTFILFQK
jgi:hypothetical protein